MRTARIFVAGHRGLVGSAIVRELGRLGHGNLILRSSADLDLRNQAAVDAFFGDQRPEYVFLAAAKVGGIHANDTYPADFLRDNLQIQTNVIDSAWRKRRYEAVLPRVELHLPETCAAADTGGCTANRAA